MLENVFTANFIEPRQTYDVLSLSLYLSIMKKNWILGVYVKYKTYWGTEIYKESTKLL